MSKNRYVKPQIRGLSDTLDPTSDTLELDQWLEKPGVKRVDN